MSCYCLLEKTKETQKAGQLPLSWPLRAEDALKSAVRPAPVLCVEAPVQPSHAHYGEE